MESIKNFFSYEYLFQTGLTGLNPSDRVYWIGAVVLFVLALFSLIYRRGKDQFTKKVWDRVFTMSLTISAFVAIWTGLRQQQIRTLSAHIVVVVIYLIALWWVSRILRYRLGKYKDEIAEHNKEQEKKKYL